MMHLPQREVILMRKCQYWPENSENRTMRIETVTRIISGMPPVLRLSYGCMNYATELSGGEVGDDDEDLCLEDDGEELYQAIMDLYPLTDSDRWYFYVVFWDTDFEFYNGRPQKHRIPVTDYEAVRFMPGNGSDKREG